MAALEKFYFHKNTTSTVTGKEHLIKSAREILLDITATNRFKSVVEAKCNLELGEWKKIATMDTYNLEMHKEITDASVFYKIVIDGYSLVRVRLLENSGTITVYGKCTS